MAIENELTKSKEELSRKPNHFDWSDWGPNFTKMYRKHILDNPYKCDECGDTYNKKDLYKIQANRVCKNCLCSG